MYQCISNFHDLIHLQTQRVSYLKNRMEPKEFERWKEEYLLLPSLIFYLNEALVLF